MEECIHGTGLRGKLHLNAPNVQRVTYLPQLYCADDNYTAPIGRFERGHLVFPRAAPGNFDDAASVVSATPTLVEATWTQSVLTLAPRALEAQDMVVTSFLVLEKAFRARERERQNRANLLGGARGGHGMYHGFTGGYI